MSIIVVVDDYEVAGAALREILQKCGFDARYIQHTDQVAEYINKIQADALVSDFYMPGMNGAELVVKVRQECPTVKFFAIVSGAADAESVKESARKADCPLYRKARDKEILIEALKKAL